ARYDVEDHGAARSVELDVGAGQITDPHHVEGDVEDAGVKPHGGQHGPPSPEGEEGYGTARPEQEEALRAGRGQGKPPELDAGDVRGHRGEVERPAEPEDEAPEAVVGAEGTEGGREAEKAGTLSPAVQALVVVHPDELAAGGTEDRAGPRHDPSIVV